MKQKTRLSQAMEDYLAVRANTHAIGTIRNDRKAITVLIEEAGDPWMHDLSHAHMDKMRVGPAMTSLSPRTTNVRMSCLSSFFKWARARGLLRPDQDLMGGYRHQKFIEPDRLRIPLAEFPALLDAANCERDRIFIAMGLFLLLRQSEIVSLRIQDVDLDSLEIGVVVHKVQRRDVMPIAPELREELVRWFAYYQEQCGPLQPEWFLVPAMKPIGMAVFSLAPMRKITNSPLIVQRAVASLGYNTNKVGCHTLRRSAARAIFQEKVDRGYDGALRDVSSWLHHKSTSMTELYLGMNLDIEKRNSDAKTGPLYPSLAADNIVNLEVYRGGQSNEAM